MEHALRLSYFSISTLLDSTLNANSVQLWKRNWVAYMYIVRKNKILCQNFLHYFVKKNDIESNHAFLLWIQQPCINKHDLENIMSVAVIHRNLSLLKMLINRKLYIFESDKDANWIQWASIYNHKHIIEYMLENKLISKEKDDKQFMNAVDKCIENNHYDLLIYMTSCQQYISIDTYDVRRMFCLACRGCHYRIAQYLYDTYGTHCRGRFDVYILERVLLVGHIPTLCLLWNIGIRFFPKYDNSIEKCIIKVILLNDITLLRCIIENYDVCEIFEIGLQKKIAKHFNNIGQERIELYVDMVRYLINIGFPESIFHSKYTTCI